MDAAEEPIMAVETIEAQIKEALTKKALDLAIRTLIMTKMILITIQAKAEAEELTKQVKSLLSLMFSLNQQL